MEQGANSSRGGLPEGDTELGSSRRLAKGEAKKCPGHGGRVYKGLKVCGRKGQP